MKNYQNFAKLTEKEQLKFLHQWHNTDLMSVPDIATMLNTYPNKIRRLGKKLKFDFRSRSESQKVALQTGKLQHPTKGKKRKQATKDKISESRAQSWADLSDTELDAIRQKHKDNWQNMSDEEKDNLLNLATQARLQAAKDGSKLEHAVKDHLLNRGIVVEFHKEHLLTNEKIHLDLYLPNNRIAIEVDGPSHFLPIWGEDKLKKVQKTDKIKDGLLLNANMCIIRIRQQQNLSTSYINKLLAKLDKTLDAIITKFPERGKRRIVI